ncbi:MAG: phosphate/phosphite/phosphonate ABC transporter substrate-binding protein [Thermodesulfovibrionales bacterium]
MRSKATVLLAVAVMTIAWAVSGVADAAELRIAIMQAQAGEARAYQPLLDYLRKNGIPASFTTAPNYTAAAEMFSKGQADAMFSGSGIAGTMIIKEVASPLVRPVTEAGTSTYSAVVVAKKGSPKFTGGADYFTGKKVIFTALASSGEFYYRSLGAPRAKEMMLAASHGAAIDALSRGQADIAIVKNHVWTKEMSKYPDLEKVGGDSGENPDNTLIVSKKLAQADVRKLSSVLLGLKTDDAPEAAEVKKSLKIREYIRTTEADFASTLALLRKAGVTKAFDFKFQK